MALTFLALPWKHTAVTCFMTRDCHRESRNATISASSTVRSGSFLLSGTGIEEADTAEVEPGRFSA
jgi:hypothetical protein